MATGKGTKDRASTTRSADNAVRAGLATAFDRIIGIGPQAGALQKALLGGVVRSQQKEAARLAAAFGKDDDRVARALARMQLLDGLQVEAVQHADQVSRFVDALRRGGIFHGYVLQPDGSPAPGCTVRAEVSDPTRKGKRSGRGKTDANGYFSFDMLGASQGSDQGATGADRLLELAQRARESTAPEPPQAGSAQSAVTARAEVLDSTGRVLYEDPIPPTFEGLSSEFRIYPLKETTETSRPARPKKKRQSS